MSNNLPPPDPAPDAIERRDLDDITGGCGACGCGGGGGFGYVQTQNTIPRIDPAVALLAMSLFQQQNNDNKT